MTWEEAADLLQEYLEDTARIVDGETPAALPPLPRFDIEGRPGPETEARIRALLADAEDAIATLAIRKAEVAEELTHMRRLKTAGAGYLRNAG